MHKLKRALSALVLTTAAIAVLGRDAIWVQAQQLRPAQTSQQQLPWKDLFEEEDPVPPGQEKRGTSRGDDDICPIAPGVLGKTIEIWSNRPLFLWMGTIKRIEVRVHDTGELLWDKTLKENDTSLIYDGEALQPGETYEWVIFEAPATPIYKMTFQVMDGTERDRITADLTRLENRMKQYNATPEMIAYTKAKYFAKNNLWANVLQEAYAVKNPSSALSKFIQTIPEQFCKT